MNDLAATRPNRPFPTGSSLYSTNVWLVFGVFCFIYLFFSWYLQTSVLTDQVYRYTLTRQVNPDKLSAYLDGQHHMAIVGYLFVPVTLVIKIFLVSGCLLTGLLLTGQRMAFRTVLKIVLFAEAAGVTSVLLKLLLLTFSHNVESLGQYMAFAPLSLYSLFNPQSVPNWLTYTLQTLDLFQAGYILLLAAGLQYYMRWPFRQSLGMVLGSYGIGLFCCMIAFAFISVSFNP